MFRILILVLTTTFMVEAQGANAAGVVCTENHLPDGNFQQYEVKANASGKFDVIYRFEEGSMIDLPSGEVSEVVIAKDMTCTFGKTTPGIASCQIKDRDENVIGYFSTKFEHEVYVDTFVSGKEYSADFMSIAASLPELEKNFLAEGYPQEADKFGTLRTDFFGHACEYK